MLRKTKTGCLALTDIDLVYWAKMKKTALAATTTATTCKNINAKTDHNTTTSEIG